PPFPAPAPPRIHPLSLLDALPISARHHLALCADEEDTIPTVPEHLVRPQLLGPLRLDATIHPVDRHLTRGLARFWEGHHCVAGWWTAFGEVASFELIYVY